MKLTARNVNKLKRLLTLMKRRNNKEKGYFDMNTLKVYRECYASVLAGRSDRVTGSIESWRRLYEDQKEWVYFSKADERLP